MGRFLPLAFFLLLVVGGGLLIGVVNTPDGWYRSLHKPFFNPPDWLFAPVWTVLYVFIAVAGWRTWRRPGRSGAMQVWGLQLGLNFLWSPAFFTLKSPLAALVVIVPLFVCILAFIRLVWREDRIAALLFVPYALWVAFATLLNGAIVALN